MPDDSIPAADTMLVARLDRLTRFASEDLARTVNRRTFLKRAGSAAFLALAGLATGQGLRPAGAAAAGRTRGGGSGATDGIVCNPPGPFCNNGHGALSGCHGAHCFSHLYYGQMLACRLFYQYFPTGCWTNSTSDGYWTCCDCQCGQPAITECGCAQFSATPSPVPMQPGG